VQKHYQLWLRKLGRKRVGEIAADVGGDASRARTLPERAVLIVERLWNDRTQLDRLIFEGFERGLYHQTICLWRTEATAEDVAKALDGRVATQLTHEANGTRSTLHFLGFELSWITHDETVHRGIIWVPSVLAVSKGSLVIRILTLRNQDWGDVLPSEPRRVLKTVRPLVFRDYLLSALSAGDVDLRGQLDYSSRAVALMKDQAIDTYSGSYFKVEAGMLRGISAHASAGARSRTPLRTAMPDEFADLIAAGAIQRCTIATSRTVHQLPVDAKLLLRPTAGEVVLSARLQDGTTLGLLDQLRASGR
jgi:hypothetical protein